MSCDCVVCVQLADCGDCTVHGPEYQRYCCTTRPYFTLILNSPVDKQQGTCLHQFACSLGLSFLIATAPQRRKVGAHQSLGLKSGAEPPPAPPADLRRVMKALRSMQPLRRPLRVLGRSLCSGSLRQYWSARDRALVLAAGAGLGGAAAAWMYGVSDNVVAQARSSSKVVDEASDAVQRQARRVDEDYKLGRQLGQGNYGVVHAATCRRTGREVAIKVIPRSHDRGDDAVRREVGVMQRVGLHSSIASLEQIYESEDAFFLVMEYVAGGELFEQVANEGSYSEARAADLMRQIADAAAFLHSQGLCHADIKPENVLLTSAGPEGRVKLVDFGLSCEANKVKPGTWAYWPPEAFSLDRPASLESDMWAIGVCMFILLSGYHPFDPHGDTDDTTLQQRIVRAEPDFNDPVWATVSTDAKTLVNCLLCREPRDRMTIEQLLQHPWLRHGGIASCEPMPQSEQRLKRFRKPSSLRAAVFATIVRQQQTQHPHAPRRSHSRGAHALEADMLTSAFRVFDPEGKGFIDEHALQRVLSTMGQGAASPQELHATLSDAAVSDREGKRVLYGDFIEMMGQTQIQRYAPGELIFQEGDEADGFLLLLSGSAEVLQKLPDGSLMQVSTLSNGDSFGETALLSHARRNATVRCTDTVEVLRLSREDFEAGFLGAGDAGVDEVQKAASHTLAFIRMISRMQRSTLAAGQCVFHEGDVGDRFFIIEEGNFSVENSGKRLSSLSSGDCFGETALLKGAPRNVRARACH